MADVRYGHPSTAEAFLGHTIIRLAHLVARHVDRALAHLELSSTSFAILLHLLNEPSLSAAELARRVAITPQSAGPLLDRLEALGLVVRHRPGVRGAKVLTEVTEAGRARLHDAVGVVARVDRWLAGVLDPQQHDELADALARMLVRASADSPPGSADASPDEG
ncbi:MAG TPA: MarR family winged helix-turn-helix transcriptional regulator [Egibacteraceae bacterium]